MGLIEYINRFQNKQEKDARSIHTLSAYKTDLLQFAAYIMNKPINDIQTADIEKYKIHLFELKLKPETIIRKLVAIRKLKEFINSSSGDSLFTAEINLFKSQRFEYLEDVLTQSDFQRLVKAAENEHDAQAICLFNSLYRTGGRISETLQLKVKDLKSEYAPVIGKGQKLRELFITDRLRAFAWEYIANRDDEEYLFINRRNRNRMSRQTAHDIIKKYAGKAKVKLSRAHAHNFRHLFCFRLADEGYSESEIADLAGHCNIQTTRIYTRKTKSELRAKINKLD